MADRLHIKKFVVLGISSGGPYAAVCAYKIPERITKAGIVVGLAPTNVEDILKGMALMNKFGWANYYRSAVMRDFSSYLCLLQSRYFPGINAFNFRAKQDQALMNTTFKKQYAASIREAFKQGIKGASWDLKLYTQDLGFELKDIKIKVYLWYGAIDKNVSLAMSKYYASQIPNTKLVTYPNEGHFVQWSHAKEILEVLMV